MRKFIYFIIFSVMILFTTKPCMAEGNFKCSMLEEGVLTIEGEGKLEQKSFCDLEVNLDEIKAIVVGEGITEIGPGCFLGFSSFEKVKFQFRVRVFEDSVDDDEDIGKWCGTKKITIKK